MNEITWGTRRLNLVALVPGDAQTLEPDPLVRGVLVDHHEPVAVRRQVHEVADVMQ